VRKIVSQEEARDRSVGAVRVLRDGRVRFSDEAGPGPELQWKVLRYSEVGGTGVFVYDSANYEIDAWRGSQILFMLYVRRSRVSSACFNIQLPPAELQQAVVGIRKAGGGVERWITPGLETTRQLVERGGGDNAARLKTIDALLRSAKRSAPTSRLGAAKGPSRPRR